MEGCDKGNFCIITQWIIPSIGEKTFVNKDALELLLDICLSPSSTLQDKTSNIPWSYFSGTISIGRFKENGSINRLGEIYTEFDCVSNIREKPLKLRSIVSYLYHLVKWCKKCFKVLQKYNSSEEKTFFNCWGTDICLLIESTLSYHIWEEVEDNLFVLQIKDKYLILQLLVDTNTKEVYIYVKIPKYSKRIYEMSPLGANTCAFSEKTFEDFTSLYFSQENINEFKNEYISRILNENKIQRSKNLFGELNILLIFK